MCEHIYIGSKDGVTCKLCGHHLTHEEYVESLRPPVTQGATKKRGRQKAVKSDADERK